MQSKIYDFTIGAGQIQALDVVGNYAKILNASGALRVRTSSGDVLELVAGQGFRGIDFTRLELIDMSGSVNTGRVLISSGGEIVDQRLQGVVSVTGTTDVNIVGTPSVAIQGVPTVAIQGVPPVAIQGLPNFDDAGMFRALSGLSFRSACLQGGVAGEFPFFQLFNDPSNSKNLIVRGVRAGLVNTVGVIGLRIEHQRGNMGFSNGVLTKTNLTPQIMPLIYSGKMTAGDTGQIFGTDNVGLCWVSPQAPMHFFDFSDDPIVLTPGFGLTVFHNASGATLIADYTFSST